MFTVAHINAWTEVDHSELAACEGGHASRNKIPPLRRLRRKICLPIAFGLECRCDVNVVGWALGKKSPSRFTCIYVYIYIDIGACNDAFMYVLFFFKCQGRLIPTHPEQRVRSLYSRCLFLSLSLSLPLPLSPFRYLSFPFSPLHIFVYVFMYMYKCISKCMHVCINVCASKYVYIYIYIYIYIYLCVYI